MSGLFGPGGVPFLRAGPGQLARPIPVPLGGARLPIAPSVPLAPRLPPVMAPRLPPSLPGVPAPTLPGRVMPTVPRPNLGGVPVGGMPIRGVPTPGGISPGGLTPIRPGGVPALAGPTVPSVGTNLGVSNNLGVTRPGVLLPGGTPATPGLPTSPVSPVTPGLPTRPGVGPGVSPGVSPGVVAPGVVAPGVMAPGMPQDQGGFLDRILGQGQQIQVGGPQAPGYAQGVPMGAQVPGGYPYQQGVIPPRGLPPGPGGVAPGLMTPNGTCRPYNNGLIGFFDNTIGAAVKRMMGIRDNCWGPAGQTTLPPGQVGPGRYTVPQGAGIPPGAMLPAPQVTMPQMTAPPMVPGAAVPPGVQLTRPMPVGPRAFQ